MALEATAIAAMQHLYVYGASKQNRTVIICLEGRGFAIKLYLHMAGDRGIEPLYSD